MLSGRERNAWLAYPHPNRCPDAIPDFPRRYNIPQRIVSGVFVTDMIYINPLKLLTLVSRFDWQKDNTVGMLRQSD